MADGSERMEMFERGWRFWPVSVVAVLLACAGPAAAGPIIIDDVAFSPTLTVEGRTLRLNGAGLRTVTLFSIHAYAAALYLEHPSHSADAIEASPEIKLLTLHYLRGASKERVEDVFRRSANRYCEAGGCTASDVQDFERLTAVFPAVKQGEHATYVFSQHGVQALFNDTLLATFDNPGFARKLLDAFIGPRAGVGSLRNALLGRPDDER